MRRGHSKSPGGEYRRWIWFSIASGWRGCPWGSPLLVRTILFPHIIRFGNENHNQQFLESNLRQLSKCGKLPLFSLLLRRGFSHMDLQLQLAMLLRRDKPHMQKAVIEVMQPHTLDSRTADVLIGTGLGFHTHSSRRKYCRIYPAAFFAGIKSMPVFPIAKSTGEGCHQKHDGYPQQNFWGCSSPSAPLEL